MRKISFILLFIFCILFQHCSNATYQKQKPLGLKINLRWVKAYPKENKAQVITGLKWALSYLGATLPIDCIEKGLIWSDQSLFQMDLNEMGFSNSSLEVWDVILQRMRESEEYNKMGGIDLGRFIMLTLNSTNHYYAITETPRTLEAFKAQYNFQEPPFIMLTDESIVALGERAVFSYQTTSNNRVDDIGFFAFEGEGSFLKTGLIPKEFEVADVMPNGQVHFALYNQEGELKLAADPKLTIAGKPAKCLWCHSVDFAPTFKIATPVKNYMPEDTFRTIIRNTDSLLLNHRKTLKSDLNYLARQDHTQMELLYISFDEPSVFRLANEWALTKKEVREILKGIKTHHHEEFPFLGKLYHRKEVEALAPYKGLKPPTETRELSEYEPNFLE